MSGSGFAHFKRRLVLKLVKRQRGRTADQRVLPDYIIIGAMRCGTTSLHNYLMQHPDVVASYKKEIKFFDSNHFRGEKWYRAHFPLITEMGPGQITGEGSPYYIFHPLAAERIAALLPQVKLIALLRNPVERSYSHYQMSVRRGRETLSFEEAIAKEPERLAEVKEKIQVDDTFPMFNYKHYSYLTRSIYADQLPVWFEHFPREQIKIIKSEDFYADPPATFGAVTAFLGLPDWELSEYETHNPGRYSSMKPETRAQLVEYFQPHNQRLYELLDTNYGWS